MPPRAGSDAPLDRFQCHTAAAQTCLAKPQTHAATVQNSAFRPIEAPRPERYRCESRTLVLASAYGGSGCLVARLEVWFGKCTRPSGKRLLTVNWFLFSILACSRPLNLCRLFSGALLF